MRSRDLLEWQPDKFGDAVQLVDGSGQRILLVAPLLMEAWWLLRRASRPRDRHCINLLFPSGVPVDWVSSTTIFRLPVVSGGAFVHAEPQAVIKWVSRIRAGCLATGARLHSRQLEDSPECRCCASPVEDEEHVLSGCSATGTMDWLQLVSGCWLEVVAALHMGPVPLPPRQWLEAHRLALMAALIPLSLRQFIPWPASDCLKFTSRLHCTLSVMVAERMRRREALHAEFRSSAPSPSSTAAPPHLRPCPLPPEQQLSPAELRRLESLQLSPPCPLPSRQALPSSLCPSLEKRGAVSCETA